MAGKLPEQITSDERKKAKAVNFGFVYGMGLELESMPGKNTALDSQMLKQKHIGRDSLNYTMTY